LHAAAVLIEQLHRVQNGHWFALGSAARNAAADLDELLLGLRIGNNLQPTARHKLLSRLALRHAGKASIGADRRLESPAAPGILRRLKIS
jgi:hypothetical protein